MIIKKTIVKSLPACMETVNLLYPDKDRYQEEREKLTAVIKVLTRFPEVFKGTAVFYMEKEANDMFLKHANDIYNESGHEATGVMVGYYLHNVEDERQKLVIGMKFLPSFGDTTNVTCEISYEDALRNADYCKTYKMYQVIWPHTHPFNMPLFYSTPDRNTLKCNFYSEFQMGFVCDNLRNDYMGFKIKNGIVCNQTLYSLDLKKTMTTGQLSIECLYQEPVAEDKNNDSVRQPVVNNGASQTEESCIQESAAAVETIENDKEKTNSVPEGFKKQSEVTSNTEDALKIEMEKQTLLIEKCKQLLLLILIVLSIPYLLSIIHFLKPSFQHLFMLAVNTDKIKTVLLELFIGLL